MITVQNQVSLLETQLEALKAYQNLREIFKAKDLFLLESLAGPEISLHKSVVGFNPVLTLKITDSILSLEGKDQLCAQVSAALEQSHLVEVQGKGHFEILDQKSTFAVLRLIESCFKVQYPKNIDLPYQFGLFGYFGFDAVRYIETLPSILSKNNPLPDTTLSIYENRLYFDLKTKQSFLIQNQLDGLPLQYDAKQVNELLSSPLNVECDTSVVPEPQRVTDTITKTEYLQWVDKASEHIRLGDVYQLQLGHEILIDSEIDPFVVYQRLRALNSSPFMYFCQFDDTTIIGASPELSINLVKNRVTIRPIAGTIKRGATEAEDNALQQELLNNPKERAEHLILVDLARNDIGRICKVNSLKVTELIVIEPYSHVFHLVSNVIGELADGLDHYDVIAASFPAGTLTGTPKVRALELIEETEKTKRSIYGGCLVFIDFLGNTEMAICIRTALHQNYSIRAAAGTVIDSNPQAEWQETLSKMSAPYLAITNRNLKNETFID